MPLKSYAGWGENPVLEFETMPTCEVLSASRSAVGMVTNCVVVGPLVGNMFNPTTTCVPLSPSMS